jgi:hypothetical protein
VIAVNPSSGVEDLVPILESIWLGHGPLLYPHAPPTYAVRHQHLNVIDALRSKGAALARHAILADAIEGAKATVGLLEEIDDGALLSLKTSRVPLSCSLVWRQVCRAKKPQPEHLFSRSCCPSRQVSACH